MMTLKRDSLLLRFLNAMIDENVAAYITDVFDVALYTLVAVGKVAAMAFAWAIFWGSFGTVGDLIASKEDIEPASVFVLYFLTFMIDTAMVLLAVGVASTTPFFVDKAANVANYFSSNKFRVKIDD